ncbi:MAG: FKBP-type peptidyl-prolyl cis-trans isomerase, partial [Chitinophagaceae bacterium]
GPASFTRKHKGNTGEATVAQVWCQRNTGSWKNMNTDASSAPVVNLLSHMDSLVQLQAEKIQIEKAIADGTTDVKENVEGVYYAMIKEGTGLPVTVNDTVTVHYKGYLFTDGSVFDETKEKPATFPLKRLIRGWQIGVPLCKVGGKIKLVIPSSMAYSIRTRAAKIPPNSILVFEIEVLDTKPAK